MRVASRALAIVVGLAMSGACLDLAVAFDSSKSRLPSANA
jgi:hypothetical protein